MRGRVWISGPVIDVAISAPGLHSTAEALQAVVDTGASVVCLDNRVPKRLGLSSVNRKAMQMADGSGVIATSSWPG